MDYWHIWDNGIKMDVTWGKNNSIKWEWSFAINGKESCATKMRRKLHNSVQKNQIPNDCATKCQKVAQLPFEQIMAWNGSFWTRRSKIKNGNLAVKIWDTLCDPISSFDYKKVAEYLTCHHRHYQSSSAWLCCSAFASSLGVSSVTGCATFVSSATLGCATSPIHSASFSSSAFRSSTLSSWWRLLCCCSCA